MDDLINLRKIIDVLDDEILSLISERQIVVEHIGKLKASQNIAIFDPKREEFLKQYHEELSQKYGLSMGFVIELFELVLAESRRTQSVING